jgi:hypothetical protein
MREELDQSAELERYPSAGNLSEDGIFSSCGMRRYLRENGRQESVEGVEKAGGVLTLFQISVLRPSKWGRHHPLEQGICFLKACVGLHSSFYECIVRSVPLKLLSTSTGISARTASTP